MLIPLCALALLMSPLVTQAGTTPPGGAPLITDAPAPKNLSGTEKDLKNVREILANVIAEKVVVENDLKAEQTKHKETQKTLNDALNKATQEVTTLKNRIRTLESQPTSTSNSAQIANLRTSLDKKIEEVRQRDATIQTIGREHTAREENLQAIIRTANSRISNLERDNNNLRTQSSPDMSRYIARSEHDDIVRGKNSDLNSEKNDHRTTAAALRKIEREWEHERTALKHAKGLAMAREAAAERARVKAAEIEATPKGQLDLANRQLTTTNKELSGTNIILTERNIALTKENDALRAKEGWSNGNLAIATIAAAVIGGLVGKNLH